MGQDEMLFSGKNFEAAARARRLRANEDVDGYDADALLNTNPDELGRYFVEKHAYEPLALLKDQISLSTQEVKIPSRSTPIRYAPGTRFTFCVPFTGDAELFGYRPTTFSTSAPEGHVEGNEVRVEFDYTEHSFDVVKVRFERNLPLIEKYVGFSADDVAAFNRDLRVQIAERIAARRNLLLKTQGLAASLGFPLKARPDAPRTYAVPEVRRRVVLPPAASTTPFAPEPTLEMAEYERILDICANMALVLERSPNDFRKMGEEALRQHFLVQLNGQYEGQATGETFNGQGKTDILIRAEGGNVFIAECKFWKGDKAFLETLDQLLGYVTWRDTKTAAFVFNRNKGFSAVLEAIGKAATTHPHYKRTLEYKRETGFRYVFGQRADQKREVILTVLAFDVPR